MIPGHIIEEIKEKANIVNIVSSYVPSLKKKGKNHLGLCPFHSEKTPSFTVSEEKGLFHCFGCGKGGNLFTFVMEMEKVGFAEAAQIIGEKTGVHVELAPGGPEKGAFDRYYAAIEAACRFYETNIDMAREYLERRKITAEKRFRIGFAPDGWDNLIKHLTGRGFKLEEMEKAGLILPRQDKSGHYDRFRNRLIFPITDPRGRVIGFGGRSVSNEEPKYLNSPDTAVFNKGENLYNLFNARQAVKDQRFALLVEGYMDAIACSQAGLSNVVAPLGTSLTEAQAKLLSRFTGIAVIAFDNDPAGLAASERAQEILKEAGLSVRIAAYSDSKDPDELVRRAGNDALIAAVRDSKPAAEFKIRRIIGRHNIKEVDGKVKAAHEISQMLAQEADRIKREEYVKLAAGLLSMKEETLMEEVRKLSAVRGMRTNLKRVTQKPGLKEKEAEKKLIRLVLEWEEALPRIKDELEPEDFSYFNGIMKKLWEKPAEEALDSLGSETEAKELRELMLSEEPLKDREKILLDCIRTIKAFKIKGEIAGIRNEMENAEKQGEHEPLKRLKSEYLALDEILRSLAR